ncbi:MAG: UvrD-helicase domain-containing protein [Rhodothermus sp.]|nr:UvrD-helicase domain-containing protein [Rhodothermus sp.]
MRTFLLQREPTTDADAVSETFPEAAARILEGLNPVQRQAVQATEGPVLIIAGPGSGKTRTLTHRIAYLIAAGRARPHQILALTFTNKAAREMMERIERLVGSKAARHIWMGTFHSIFARILRREGHRIGYTSDFSIYDTDDAERLLRELMLRYQIDPRQYSPRTIRHLISSAKNQMIGPEAYARLAASPLQEKAARLYGPYQEALRKANALDFDDLLLKPIELFEQHPDVLQQYQERWRYLHIDEYQDTNRVQYVLARKLAETHRNLCVVGDDAQSIYAFRGADIGNILSFQRDYPDARVIRLEQNYRSTRRILKLAEAIIRHNRDQLEKQLWTENPEGDPIVLVEALSERDEAQKIEQRIRDLHVRYGYAFRDFAVLYRTNAQSRSLEEALRRGGIPYRVVGSLSFYQRKEIKDVLAYLRLLVNPHDTASLQRVINYPARGIGQRTLEILMNYARQHGLSLWQTLERVEAVGLPARAQQAVQQFHFLIARHAARMDTMPADELARSLLQESGLFEELRREGTPEALARWENVQELLNAIAEYVATAGEQATLSGFLQEVALLTDLDEMPEDNRVTLMTLHASKGLEFPVVFITGLEEGLFPLAQATQDRKDLEEERRLFYVGVTRAQRHLFLCYARSRYRYGEQQPSVRSRFLEELDTDVIVTEAGLPFRRGQVVDRKLRTGHYVEQDPHSSRKPRSRTDSALDGARRVVYDEGIGEIVPGARVEHPMFGEGKVLTLEGQGDQARAVVFFPEVGQKKLVLKFARLRRID